MHILKLVFFVIVLKHKAIASGESEAFRTVIQNVDQDLIYRLPNTTYPSSYEISLFTRVDLSIFDFVGQVKINIAVASTTDEIVLHAKQLNITSIRLFRYSGTVPIDVKLQPYVYEKITEFLRIKTDGSILIAGDRLLLEILYTGTLRSDNAGFYRTSYVDEKGDQK